MNVDEESFVIKLVGRFTLDARPCGYGVCRAANAWGFQEELFGKLARTCSAPGDLLLVRACGAIGQMAWPIYWIISWSADSQEHFYSAWVIGISYLPMLLSTWMNLVRWVIHVCIILTFQLIHKSQYNLTTHLPCNRTQAVFCSTMVLVQ